MQISVISCISKGEIMVLLHAVWLLFIFTSSLPAAAPKNVFPEHKAPEHEALPEDTIFARRTKPKDLMDHVLLPPVSQPKETLCRTCHNRCAAQCAAATTSTTKRCTICCNCLGDCCCDDDCYKCWGCICLPCMCAYDICKCCCVIWDDCIPAGCCCRDFCKTRIAYCQNCLAACCDK